MKHPYITPAIALLTIAPQTLLSASLTIGEGSGGNVPEVKSDTHQDDWNDIWEE